jgi:transcriptional regulator with XRE-family HTH domain
MATPREQLADLLRQARLSAGYGSHAAFAKHLHVSRSVVTKAESASHPSPTDGLLAAWAGATGVPLDKLTGLARQARSGIPDWFVPWLVPESSATLLRCWAPTVFPGLFQTESYARAILAVERHPQGNLAELVAARLERQQVIGRAYLVAVIDQHVLERQIGSAAIMSEQCGHLAMLGERQDVAVHVIPHGTNMGLWGAFDIATKDGTVTVRLSALEDVTSTAEHVIIKAMQAFDKLLGAALPIDPSLEMIRASEEKWKAQI